MSDVNGLDRKGTLESLLSSQSHLKMYLDVGHIIKLPMILITALTVQNYI
jgi:hypothetical protein